TLRWRVTPSSRHNHLGNRHRHHCVQHEKQNRMKPRLLLKGSNAFKELSHFPHTMEEISEETKTLTISLTTHYLNQVEAVLGLLSFVGFGWLLILLFDVLTTSPVIMANPASYGSRAGIWIQ